MRNFSKLTDTPSPPRPPSSRSVPRSLAPSSLIPRVSALNLKNRSGSRAVSRRLRRLPFRANCRFKGIFEDTSSVSLLAENGGTLPTRRTRYRLGRFLRNVRQRLETSRSEKFGFGFRRSERTRGDEGREGGTDVPCLPFNSSVYTSRPVALRISPKSRESRGVRETRARNSGLATFH